MSCTVGRGRGTFHSPRILDFTLINHVTTTAEWDEMHFQYQQLKKNGMYTVSNP